MTLFAAEDYGQLTPLVVAIGSVVSATAAILMGFRGRAKWEPAEEDVSKGPQRVASLLAAVAIVLLWVTQNNPKQVAWLSKLAIGCGLATILFLLAYGWLISVYTYKKITSPETGQAQEIKVIGGFRLIESATEELKKAVISIQQLFAGRGYEEDLVWTRASRAAAKMLFVISYLGLTICGVITLAAADMMILLNKPASQ
jgi:hypothetical protein